MQQMQKLQKQMEVEQKELNATEFKGTASDEAVVVTFTGDKMMKDIQVKPEAIDADDPDLLQDLVIQAVNDVMKKINDETQTKMGKYARGLPR